MTLSPTTEQDGEDDVLLDEWNDSLDPDAFVETVIRAALQRLEYYNSGRFRCRENSLAITHLEEALHWLDHRTRSRVARGVEGTHQP